MNKPRITITPLSDPTQTIDVTDAVIGAVAAELWRVTGGNAELNWLEAERFVQDYLTKPIAQASQIVEPKPMPARQSTPLRIAA